jgi:hypothetical protein
VVAATRKTIERYAPQVNARATSNRLASANRLLTRRITIVTKATQENATAKRKSASNLKEIVCIIRDLGSALSVTLYCKVSSDASKKVGHGNGARRSSVSQRMSISGV